VPVATDTTTWRTSLEEPLPLLRERAPLPLLGDPLPAFAEPLLWLLWARVALCPRPRVRDDDPARWPELAFFAVRPDDPRLVAAPLFDFEDRAAAVALRERAPERSPPLALAREEPAFRLSDAALLSCVVGAIRQTSPAQLEPIPNRI
jgi:hypothetical protein